MNSRAIVTATLTAGSLDIAAAMALTAVRGRPIGGMLRTVASGPLGGGVRDMGAAGAFAGLLVHYALMAMMVTAFAIAADRMPELRRKPLRLGIAYGVLLYLVMYWIVIPLRWPPETFSVTASEVLVPLSIHIALVGIPIALIVARMRSSEPLVEEAPETRG